MFQNSGGGLFLDNQVSGKSERPFKLIERKDFKGRWHQIEMHVRWSREEDGFLNLWVNGELKAEYTGATMASGDIYFKYGVYRSFLSRYKAWAKVNTVPTQTALFAPSKNKRSVAIGRAPVAFHALTEPPAERYCQTIDARIIRESRLIYEPPSAPVQPVVASRCSL